MRLLCAGYISIGEIISILTAQQTHLVGLCHISVAVDTNALKNAAITAVWQCVATDTLVDQNVIVRSGSLAGSVLVNILSCCKLLAFRLMPPATVTPQSFLGKKIKLINC